MHKNIRKLDLFIRTSAATAQTPYHLTEATPTCLPIQPRPPSTHSSAAGTKGGIHGGTQGPGVAKLRAHHVGIHGGTQGPGVAKLRAHHVGIPHTLTTTLTTTHTHYHTPSLPHTLTTTHPHCHIPSLPHPYYHTHSLPHILTLTATHPHYHTPSLPHTFTTTHPHYHTPSLPHTLTGYPFPDHIVSELHQLEGLGMCTCLRL